MKDSITDQSERALYQNIKLTELDMVLGTFWNVIFLTTNRVFIKPNKLSFLN